MYTSMCAINYASNVAHRRRERFPRAATQPAAAHYRERDSAFVGCRSARRCDGARAGGTAGDRIFACIHVTSDHHHHWSPLVTTTATIFTSYHKLATTIITTGTTTIRARSPRTTGAAAARSTTTKFTFTTTCRGSNIKTGHTTERRHFPLSVRFMNSVWHEDAQTGVTASRVTEGPVHHWAALTPADGPPAMKNYGFKSFGSSERVFEAVPDSAETSTSMPNRPVCLFVRPGPKARDSVSQ
jgi:hypothetical protein